MTIRKFTPADRSSLLDLAVASLRENSFGAALVAQFGELDGLAPDEMLRTGIADHVDRNPNSVLVAESDGETAGFVITQCFAKRRIGWVPILAVAEAHQRKGVGRSLLQAALAHFREQGMKFARIETLDTNEGSQRLFPQLGFSEFAREIQYFMKL